MKRPSILPSTLLLREAIRASHRWQTWAGRVAFTILPLSILLSCAWILNKGMSDPSKLGVLGRVLFLGVTGSLSALAIGFAPVTTATGIREELSDGSVDLVLLTHLSPGQIANSKIWARILGLLSLTLGAMPILALSAALGGVSPIEVLTATAHITMMVITSGAVGGVIGLFTRSSLLVSILAALFAILVYGMVPAFAAIVAGDPLMMGQLSLLGWLGGAHSQFLLAPLANLPLPIALAAITGRLFEVRATQQPDRNLYTRQAWYLNLVLGCCVLTMLLLALGVGLLVLRVALVAIGYPAPPPVLYATCVWMMGTCSIFVSGWAFLRLAVDIAHTSEFVLRLGNDKRPTRPIRVWANPAAWWAMRSWKNESVAIQGVWFAAVLLCSQTILWMLPGGLLGLAFMLSLTSVVLAIWLVTKSMARERSTGTLELIRLSGMPPSNLLNGKLLGAALPTVPLALLALPPMLLGTPYLALVIDGPDAIFSVILRTLLGWIWLIPLWVASVLLAFRLSLRMTQRTAFASSAGSLVMIVGMLVLTGLLRIEIPVLTPILNLVFGPASPTASPISWFLSICTMGGLGLLLYVFALRDLRVLSVWLACIVGASVLGSPREALAGSVQADGLYLEAHPFAQGLVREDGATEVRLEITNRGPDTVVTVRPDHQRAIGSLTRMETRHQLELPRGATKVVSMRIRSEFIRAESALVIQTADGRQARVPVDFQLLPPGERGLVIVGTDRLGFPSTRSIWTGPTPGSNPQDNVEFPNVLRTGLAEIDHLPEHTATWSNTDQVVWPQIDPSSVSPERLDALLRWVAGGGHLTVSITDTWPQVQESPLVDALPIIPAGTREWTSLEPLEKGLGIQLPADSVMPIAMTHSRPEQVERARWTVVERAPNEAVWSIGTYGIGTITVLAFDPRQPLLKPHRDTLWSRVLWLPPDHTTSTEWREWIAQPRLDSPLAEPAPSLLGAFNLWTPMDGPCLARDQQSGDVFDEESWPHPAEKAVLLGKLAEIAQAQAIPMSWLVLFSVAYLLMIGPVDWFILRTISRRTWTWATFPIWVGAFTAVALAGTTQIKGDRSIINQLEWVDWLPGTQQWRGQSYYALFSAERSHIALRSTMDDSYTEFLGDGGFSESKAYRSRTGADGVEWDSETWTLGYAYTRWNSTGQGRLEWTKEANEWTVHNASGLSFSQVAIMEYDADDPTSDSIARALGPLEAGGRIQWSETSSPARVDPDSDLGWAIRQNHDFAGPDGGHIHAAHHRYVFLGLSDQPVDEPILEGVEPIRSSLTVVRVPMGAPLAPATSPMSGEFP